MNMFYHWIMDKNISTIKYIKHYKEKFEIICTKNLPQPGIINRIIEQYILHENNVLIIFACKERISSISSNNVFFYNTLNLSSKMIHLILVEI